MNTYEITFTRENGSTGKDRVTAANEKQARKDFREIYRHSSATITDITVATENVPASKQQERDALDQIRAIMDTLGPDSYLATAFAGCFEDAEENIKNDFACSMKQRLESAEAKRIEAELGYNRLVDKLAESEKALEAARADIEKKDEEITALNARISAIQRPAEPVEISDELLADLATFSSVYIERIQKAIIENAGQIAKNATLVRLLHQYSTRLEQERIEYAREVYNCAKHGTEFRPSNTKAIRQLADVTLDKYRSSIPRKAFEEFVRDIITGENRATAFRYEASPICRASFPSTLDEDGAPCTVEVTVYRLNAVAVTAFLLDGPETLLRHIGLDERDTYTTKHETDNLVTVVHITRLERGGTA